VVFEIGLTGRLGPYGKLEQEAPFGERIARQQGYGVGGQLDGGKIGQQQLRTGCLAELQIAPRLSGALCQTARTRQHVDWFVVLIRTPAWTNSKKCWVT